MQRIAWLDLVKGISIILVVYYHFIIGPYNRGLSQGMLDKNIFDSINHFITYNLAPLRMPLFFLVSGYLSKSAIDKPWSAVFTSRVSLYIYLFVIWGIVHRAIVFLLGIDTSDFIILKSNYAESTLEFLTLTLIGASSLWYLYALALYFCICKFFNSYRVTCIIALIICSVASKSLPLIFPYKNMIYCVFFYAVGVFYGEKLFSLFESLKWKSLYYLAPALLVLTYLRFINFSHYFLESVVFVLLAIFTLMYLSKLFRFRLLNKIGKNTLAVYIFHTPLLEFYSFIALPFILELEFLIQFNHIGYSIFMPLILIPFTVLSATIVATLIKKSPGKVLFDFRQ